LTEKFSPLPTSTITHIQATNDIKCLSQWMMQVAVVSSLDEIDFTRHD